MARLREQLNELYLTILSADPNKAINGTKLLAAVKPLLVSPRQHPFSEAAIRSSFSEMSRDPTQNIAKVDQGHGYYLRSNPQPALAETETSRPASLVTEVEGLKLQEQATRRNNLREEKFRSIYASFRSQEGFFPVILPHTTAKRQPAGTNKWKFPDVIVLKWDVGELVNDVYRLSKPLLEVKKSLGEQPCKLASVELKVELTLADFREAFFQCVSNSRWAHSAELAVAAKIDDERLAEELRRLGTSFGVSVVSFGFTPEYLDSLSSPSELRNLQGDALDEVMSKSDRTQIVPGSSREGLDWEHIKDLKDLSTEFSDIFRWIAYCLKEETAYTHEEWAGFDETQKKRKGR